MQCVVIGIFPPNENLAATLHDDIHLDGLQWQAGCHLAKDFDHDDRLTLLITATLDEEVLVPDDVVKAVNDYLFMENQDAASYHVELWASAGAPLPLRPLQGYEPHVMMKKSDDSNNNVMPLEKSRHAMQEWGLVVRPQIMSLELVREFRHVVDKAIAAVERKLAHYRPSLQIGNDAFQFREIASRNKNRFDLRLDIASMDSTGAMTQPKAIPLVHRILDESSFLQRFLCVAMGLDEDMFSGENETVLRDQLDFDVSVVYSRRRAPAQGWHADGNHLPGASEAGWNVKDGNKQLAPPYAICLFVPLINLDENVGYTQFWPGSHAHRKLAGMGPVAHVTQSVWNSCGCRAGDGILYDYRLLHQGMPHHLQSNVAIRPVLQIIFKQRSYNSYVSKENYGREPIAGAESQAVVA